MNKCVLAAFAVCGLGLGSAAPAESAESVEWDGLQKTRIKGIDHAYVRPGVDLSKYNKVLLDPVTVAFDKNWKPERIDSHLRMTQEDRDRIKKDLAQLATKTFTETLSRKDGYPVVAAPGSDVMRVSAALNDVYINAPDVATASRSRTYVMNAGRMTLCTPNYGTPSLVR